MKLSTAKEELWRIGRLYPTLAGVMTKPITIEGDHTTIGELWAREIQDLDSAHLGNVIDDFAEMRRELPEPADRLVQVIKAEVLDLMERDREKLEQHEKYLGKDKTVPWRKPLGDQPLWARCVAFLQRYKQRPEEVGGEAMAESRVQSLIEWSEGREGMPDWLTPEQQRFLLADEFPRSREVAV